jgi:hypothetical protein
MIEQTLKFCSTKSGGEININGQHVPFIAEVLKEMNEADWRAVNIAYNPHIENRAVVLFEKSPQVKITYNEVDI